MRDKRIPLEMCPSSNLQTGAAESIAEHPIGLLRRLRFRVTVNTDNRLMSGTSMSREMALLAEAFGYGLDDLQWFTVNAMKSAFIPFDERLALIDGRDQAGLRRPVSLSGRPDRRQVIAGTRQPTRTEQGRAGRVPLGGRLLGEGPVRGVVQEVVAARSAGSTVAPRASRRHRGGGQRPPARPGPVPPYTHVDGTLAVRAGTAAGSYSPCTPGEAGGQPARP